METTAATPSLAETLDRLARLEPVSAPVLSLYLNAQPDSRGKDHYAPFLRKELHGRIEQFEKRSPARESFEKDIARIDRYLSEELRPSANGVAIFASSATEFFEPLQLDAPIERNRLTVGDRPHLYPLARIVDRHPRHGEDCLRRGEVGVDAVEQALPGLLDPLCTAGLLERSRGKDTTVGHWELAGVVTARTSRGV